MCLTCSELQLIIVENKKAQIQFYANYRYLANPISAINWTCV